MIEEKKDSKNNGIWIVIQTVKDWNKWRDLDMNWVLAAIKVLGPTLKCKNDIVTIFKTCSSQ